MYTEHNYVRHVHIFIHPRLNSNTGKRILYDLITFVVPNNKNNTCIKQQAENNQFLLFLTLQRVICVINKKLIDVIKRILYVVA